MVEEIEADTHAEDDDPFNSPCNGSNVTPRRAHSGNSDDVAEDEPASGKRAPRASAYEGEAPQVARTASDGSLGRLAASPRRGSLVL